MKTAISIPDDLFAEAERLSRKLGKSRSQLYADAVRLYIATHDPEGITAQMNAVIDELNGDATTEEDLEFTRAAARLVFERIDWK